MGVKSSCLTELSMAQLNCHLYRHSFDEPEIFLEIYTRRHITGNKTGWVMIHKCKSCGVQRSDYVEPETYELWDRKYWYTNADGYLLTFAATTQDFRAEMIRRRRLVIMKNQNEETA